MLGSILGYRIGELPYEGIRSESHPYSPRKVIEYGVYGGLLIVYPKQHSIYLRGTICLYPPQKSFFTT